MLARFIRIYGQKFYYAAVFISFSMQHIKENVQNKL